MTQRTLAGTGAIAFGALTLGASILAAAPGGSYSRSYVEDFLSPGHRAAALAALVLGLLGVIGLVGLLAHLREAVGGGLAGTLVWGAGLTGAASLAAGWAVTAGQVVAHWEGGSAVVVSPAITYLISEIAVVMIFGSGAMLVGAALLIFVAAAPRAQLGRMRWPILLAGVCGVASLAYFTFYVLMLLAIALGAWLVRGAAVPQAGAAAAPGLE